MTVPARRARLLLFAGAVVIPNAVLVVAAVRLAAQERELAARRREERRAVLAASLGQELLARLERIRASALEDRVNSAPGSAEASGLVLAGTLRGETLVLPWDDQPPARLAGTSTYARLIASGEAAEFRQRNLTSAATLYARAAEIADDERERGEAKLREARALALAGRAEPALTRYRRVATMPPTVRDGDGIPLALYAAEALLVTGSADTGAARTAIERTLQGLTVLGPPALYALRDLGTRADVAVGDRIAERLTVIDQVHSLRASLPGLLAINAQAGVRSRPAWIAFGSEPWLVSVARGGESGAFAVVVVRPAVAIARIAADGGPLARIASAARLTTSSDQGGEPLGASLPGARVSFIEPILASDDSRIGAQLVLVVLPVVATLTLLVTWLFWRDVRRDVAATELRSQFVSSVSHELKTPLTSIRMFAETLLMGRPSDDSGRREYLETIVQESERLTRLINNVLDFSRIERGEQRYQFAPTDLADVVRDSARAMSYALRQDGFEITLAVPDTLQATTADRDALVQAVLNLLSNAMKYSGDRRAIALSLARENGDALIRVRDCGLGVAATEQRRIFQRYYRTNETVAANIPGTGLGLAVVAHVAEAHGGSVEVESVPGQGSTFTLRLPLNRTV